jgi:hypothetical protein
VVPFVVMLLALLGAGWRRFTRAEGLLAATVVVTGAGYYAVYLITPWDLRWHLNTSLVRLLLQLWPAVIFFWALALPPRESGPARPVGRLPRVATVGVNVAIAGIVLSLFSRQLAGNEMTAARIGGGRTSVVMGEGWFPRETDGRSHWQWSRGEAVIFLHRQGEAPAPVTFRFEVRGLGQRRATLAWGERVLWQGVVAEALAVVEIPGVIVPAGMTELRFSTDAPGILESNAPGARALTFALYNPRLQ